MHLGSYTHFKEEGTAGETGRARRSLLDLTSHEQSAHVDIPFIRDSVNVEIKEQILKNMRHWPNIQIN